MLLNGSADPTLELVERLFQDNRILFVLIL